MAVRPGPPVASAEPPEFQEVGDGTSMQWPIGPLTAGIGEAEHLRLTLEGTRIVRAESRLGYTHKGTLLLMRGKSPRVAARFAARLAGDATVAHSVAFAVATEMALTVQAPPRAAALRSAMGALERIATLLDDLASLAGLLGDARAHGYCGLQQEYLRRALAGAFGHRLMMDGVVPGGVSGEPDANGLSVLCQLLGGLAESLPAIRRMFGSGLLAERLTGLGVVDPRLAEALGVDGIVVEAGRFGGDAAARCRARLDGIARDIEACVGLLAALPEGPLTVALPLNSGEGVGHAAAARGSVWHWLRLDHGQIAAVFPNDPGWALRPLAEATLAGAGAGDAAAILWSLGAPVSGMDL
jgi:Ni,Fe-hydrogenase III large subunit